MAGWGSIASNLARLALQDFQKKIVETLEVDNEVLDNIHEQFVTVIALSRIRVHSFQEAKGISGVNGMSGKVVDDFSSKLDLPTLERVEGINANHIQMARCRSRSDESYRAIAGVLKQFLNNAGPKIAMPLRPSPQAQPGGSSSTAQEAPLSRVSAVYCNVPPRNRRFVGRTAKLTELEARLLGSGDCQKLALVGLGGVGKTQVALQLVYVVKERWPDCSIFWVPTVSGERFEQAYRTIAHQCSIALTPSEEDPKETVRKYLSGDAASKWLLVVDNADNEEVLFGTPDNSRGAADFLPESKDGLTLFTTRHRQTAVALAGKEVVDLQTMTNEEAESFLRKSLIREDWLQDRAATAELLTELTHLPLAIAQAAAYLNAMQVSLREYLSLLKRTEQDTISLLSREFRDETRYTGAKQVKNAVARTWLVSFNQIRRSDPVAADLLSCMSCLEPTAISRRLLPAVEPAEQMVYALGTLRAYAFVTQDEVNERYDLHRLVHLAAKVWLKEQAATGGMDERMIVHLAEIFPSDDYSNRLTWREYFPHVFRVLGNTKGLDVEARYELCMWVGRCLQADGRVREAVSWLSECCLWRQSHFPEDHPSRLASQHALAGAYEANGQVREAVELLEHVVAVHKEALAEDHPDRLASQHALAWAYRANGQVREAVELLEHVVAIKKNVLREDHPSRLVSQDALFYLYAQQHISGS